MVTKDRSNNMPHISKLEKLHETLDTNFDRICGSVLSHRSFDLNNGEIKLLKEKLKERSFLILSRFNQHRHHFARNRRSALNLKIFSLGTNCYSRSFSVRWGFKPYAEEGENSHPFDLAVHKLTTIAKLIKTNFSGYFNKGSLEWKDGKKFPVNTELGINYNHDNIVEFKADDFKLLKERYNRRIANFRNDVLVCNNAIFVCTIWIDSRKIDPASISDKIVKLRNAVIDLKSQSHIVFIVISSDEDTKTINRDICKRKYPDVSFISESTPFRNYNAFADFHKAGGFEMELRISNKLHQIINRFYGS